MLAAMSAERSGGGDPARELAMLWGLEEPGARGPRRGLASAQIAAAAIALADEVGLAAFSMRTVAERLGVGTMTLYRYVHGRAELLDLMLDRVLGEVPRPVDVPGGWRGRLERIARDRWALGHRHPWMLQVPTGRPVLGPGVTATYEYELQAVDGLGLSDVEMDAVVTLVGGYATAAARASIDARETSERTGLTDAQWWEANAPVLAQVFDTTRFPLAARVGAAAGEAYGAAFDPERAFVFGLRRVLDGIAVLVEARGAQLS